MDEKFCRQKVPDPGKRDRAVTKVPCGRTQLFCVTELQKQVSILIINTLTKNSVTLLLQMFLLKILKMSKVTVIGRKGPVTGTVTGIFVTQM